MIEFGYAASSSAHGHACMPDGHPWGPSHSPCGWADPPSVRAHGSDRRDAGGHRWGHVRLCRAAGCHCHRLHNGPHRRQTRGAHGGYDQPRRIDCPRVSDRYDRGVRWRWPMLSLHPSRVRRRPPRSITLSGGGGNRQFEPAPLPEAESNS